ncbi:MAG TPA: LytTR family DNA-binding domain-containing protein [Niabella sp.]|nr:LytTR family DNA-binding domain-containing protein [Niabella sp.]
MHLRKVLNQSHPGYGDLRVYFKTVLGISAVVFLILFVFQPFHIGERNIEGSRLLTAVLYAGVAAVTMSLAALWIILFPNWFDDKKWTLGKELIVLVYQMITISIVIWLINRFRTPEIHVEDSYPGSLFLVFAIGIMPYIVVTFIRHNYLLQHHLRAAKEMNAQLHGKKLDPPDEDLFLINSKLSPPVRLSEFLYAESRGNNLYIQYADKTTGGLLFQLVRSSMKEFQLANSKYGQLFRCHRAFIINMDKILEMRGNAAGYEIMLHNSLAPVAVSRSNVDAFKRLLA